MPPADLPPPLPPEDRTVGQLVAEAIRLYGRRFWPTLALGLSLAALNQLALSLDRFGQLVATATVGAILLSISYAVASTFPTARRIEPRALATGIGVGAVVFAPTPFFAIFFILPAVAWLALFGLAVPAAVVERRGFAAALRRGVELARADYVHALGSLATLTIVYFLSRTSLLFLLRGQADATIRVAAFLADLVVGPLLFLGAAILFVDQSARFELRPRGRVAQRRA